SIWRSTRLSPPHSSRPTRSATSSTTTRRGSCGSTPRRTRPPARTDPSQSTRNRSMSNHAKTIRQIIRRDTARDGAPVSPVVKVGDLVFTGGQVALDANGDVKGDLETQTHALFKRLSNLLEQAGGSLRDVLALVSFHTDVRDMETVLNIG